MGLNHRNQVLNCSSPPGFLPKGLLTVEGFFDMEEQNHIILMTRTYGSGAQEWYCPVCGRRFIVQWKPEYQRVILEIGDNAAIHNTGTGAFIAKCHQPDESYLEPWQEWLETIDFESYWNESEDHPDQ
jgi:hypothetical protein